MNVRGGVADAEKIQIQKGFAKHSDGNIRIDTDTITKRASALFFVYM